MITINDSKCPKDHPCPAVANCPVKALTQKSIFSAPKLDMSICLDCGKCSKICPMGAIIHSAS